MSNLFHRFPSFLRFRYIRIAILIIAYCLLFFVLYPFLGTSVATIEVIPVIIIAWVYGLRLGILSSLIIAFLNMFILFPAVGIATSEIMREGGAVGETATLLIAIIVGYFHELRSKIKLELSERLQVEKELRETQDELESRVLERTLALETSERNYRTLLEQASDGILIVDADGKLLVVNEKVCEILDCPEEDLIGSNLMGLIFPDDIDYVSDFQDSIDSGQTVIMETWLTRSDKSLVPIESSSKKLQDGRYLAIIRDISRRKKTEAALRASEEQFRSFFEHSGVAAAIYDESGTLILINSLGAQNMGWELPEEKIGQALTTLFPRESAQVYLSRIQRVFESGQGHLYEDQFPLPQDMMYFLTNTSPIFDEAQKVIAVQVVSQNISDLKKAEKALDESRERLQLVVQHMPIMMNAFDENGLVVAWNQECERVTGYLATEMIDNPNALKSLHPEIDYRAELRHRGHAYHDWEWLLTCKNGSRRTISWSDVSEELPIPGWASWRIGIDVTERNILEMQLRQSQKLDAIGRVAGGVAHDFNNILTVINNYSDLLTKKYPDEDSDANRYGHLINEMGERAARLIQQLLTVARQKPLELKILSLNDSVRNTIELLQHMVGIKVEIQTNLAAQNDLIKTDSSQLDQILMNLAVNARDAMPDGGVLVIETSDLILTKTEVRVLFDLTPGSYLQLRIQDTGTGMNDFVKEHIFEPFFTTKPEGEGSGLGLATIHGIIKQSGGDIIVDSKLNEGTTFTILFPGIEPST